LCTGVSSFAAYGGHFSLELVGPLKQQDTAVSENAVDIDIPYYEPGNGFQYLQIAVDNYRISKVIASGGNVLTGYGKCCCILYAKVQLFILNVNLNTSINIAVLHRIQDCAELHNNI
jgi:hypothetical protein